MKQLHSLPNPEEMGFSWPAFSKALERIRNVERRRRQAELRDELELPAEGEPEVELQSIFYPWPKIN
jgi:hypothetical protein